LGLVGVGSGLETVSNEIGTTSEACRFRDCQLETNGDAPFDPRLIEVRSVTNA
jgi:hypothetical protein